MTTTDQDWAGLAVSDGKLYQLSGSLADFVLDYASYDPVFSSGPKKQSFRNGVLTLTHENVSQFLDALHARALGSQEVERWIDSKAEGNTFIAFIDLDSKRFVHSYFDLPLEDYVPRGWKSQLSDPSAAVRQWLQRR